MTRSVRAAWSSFRRIHLAALVTDWQRTLLSVIGVALGVTVVLGTVVLKSEITRPFEAFGPALTHAADAGILEISPIVANRLPIATVERLRVDVPGADAVIPIVAALTPVTAGTTDHGFLLLGGSCQVELLVGPFDCEKRARDVAPAAGPGVPLQIPEVIAERHDLHLGQELLIPGLPPGSAHVGWTFAEFDRVEGINDGYVLLAPSTEVAADLLSMRGFVTGAFVLPGPDEDVTADVDRVIAGTAIAAAPQPHLPAVFANGKQSFDLVALAGIIVGVLVAVNTILLAVEDRRAVMGTIGAIGASPAGLLGGMLCEGALVGLLGGLLGVPTGFLLGTYLVSEFGTAMLAGSGGAIAAHFTPDLIAIGAGAGIACGVFAMAGPAWKLVRDGPLASMASAGGIQRVRTIPLWPLVVGVLLMAGSVVVMSIFESGSLPLQAGVNGMTLGLCGLVLATVWLAPRLAVRLIAPLTRMRPDVGRLLEADVRRYTMLFALSAALLAESSSLAIGSHAMQVLGTDQIAAQKSDRLPNALLITAQSVLDQRDGRLSDATFESIAGAAGGHAVSSHWRSSVDSGGSTRIVAGVRPGGVLGRAYYAPTDAPEQFWKKLQEGQIGLSEIAASRLGARTGDVIELPTVAGPKRYLVAGLFEPRMVNDAAVGDLVLAREEPARTDWAAVRDQVAVVYSPPEDASARRDDFLALDSGLWVYDDREWRSVATEGISRFLEPFTLAGYVVMVAAGLSMLNVFVLGLVQRKRERAALRALGMTSGQEQAVIAANAGLLGVIVAGVATLGGVGLTYLWSLGAPVYYGIAISWAVPVTPSCTAVTIIFVLVAIAAAYPVLHARRLEPVEVLRSG